MKKSIRMNLRSVAISFACLAVTTVFASCDDGDEPATDAPAFVEFSFANQRGTSDIEAKKRTAKAVAECGTNLASLAPAFKLSPAGTTATVDGKAQESGKTAQNFADAIVYTLATPDGETAEWTITITLPDGCPTLIDCERKIFNEIALAKMIPLGKTIPDACVVVRSANEYNWGTEMEVYTPNTGANGTWGCVRYEFFYCRDYYNQQKQLDEQRTNILDYKDAGLWYS
ncbi:hypothetical protein FACS1894181_16090 [Bacteroidia bacterium]|nr:hypothetical protein FACS1894181_16090 [Bacteroidia bacterium]